MIEKSASERTLRAPGGLFHCPFHLDHSHNSSCSSFSLFNFSPLSLRRGVAVVCFEVTKVSRYTFLCAPCDLGDPGWGIPGFRMVLCCFYHLRVWPCVCRCSSFSNWCFLVVAIPRWDDTKLSPLALIQQWIGSQSSWRWCFCLFGFLLGLFWFVVAFVVCLLFFVLFLFVCLCCSWNDGFLDYVQVPHQFSLAVLNKQTTSCINLEMNDSAMPQSVLNDLAKVKGVARKKESHCFDVSGVTGDRQGSYHCAIQVLLPWGPHGWLVLHWPRTPLFLRQLT